MIFNFLSLFLTTLAGGLLLYLLKMFKTLKYFDAYGIPHEKPVPIFGNMLPVVLRKRSVADLIVQLYNSYSTAKYFGFYDFTIPVFVLRDIELLKFVSVKNFDSFSDHELFGKEGSRDPLFARNLFNLRGEKWHDVRSLLSPSFTSTKMKMMYKLISESATNFVDILSKETEENKMREMKEALSRFTNDVIATCAFGISVNTMKDPNNDFYVLGKEATNLDKLSVKIMFMRQFPLIAKIFDMKLLTARINGFFHETIRTTMKMRDEKGITRPDMLQLLMDARAKEKKVDLTPEEITAQAFVFFFGGFDTTSTTMAFMAYELAINKEIQEKLQAEIDAVFLETNGEPSYEAVNGIEYLDATVNETLRKYPVLSVLDRVCTKRFELPPTVPGAKSVIVEPGTIIWIPVVGYHSDSNYYNDHDKFIPERFLKNGSANSKATTFLSFGIGPRQCIGNRFSLLVMKTVFFHLLAKFNLSVCPKTTIPLKISKKSLGFAASDGYWVKLEKRK